MKQLLLVLALLSLSCSDDSPLEIPSDTDLVPFDSLNNLFGESRLASQWSSGKARLDLRSQEAWATVYTQVTGSPEAQPITFTDRAVIFAASGVRQSTGYDISIDQVRKARDGRMYVIVRELRPGTGCGVFPTQTSPVTAIRTISDYTAVIYLERVQIDPCTSG